jgi:methenyltetrahydrofolate cyclohydrolase
VDLVNLTVEKFVWRAADAAPKPWPGGGSVAALCGALSAALCAMVGRLTLGKEKYRAVWKEMEETREKADALSRRLLALTNRDADAYDKITVCLSMPKVTEADKEARRAAIEEATKEAAQVPMETLRAISELVGIVEAAVEKGNSNCLSDAAVACQTARAGALGASYNVWINLNGISDKEFSSSMRREVDRLMEEVTARADRIGRVVEDRLRPR